MGYDEIYHLGQVKLCVSVFFNCVLSLVLHPVLA